jgi:hypothetical protein
MVFGTSSGAGLQRSTEKRTGGEGADAIAYRYAARLTFRRADGHTGR